MVESILWLFGELEDFDLPFFCIVGVSVALDADLALRCLTFHRIIHTAGKINFSLNYTQNDTFMTHFHEYFALLARAYIVLLLV